MTRAGPVAAAAAALTLAGALAAPAGEWRRAEPGYAYRFPRDHGAHRAFSTEWWYYTGHLDDAGGRRFGYQLTFFRVGVAAPGERDGSPADSARSAWHFDELFLGHFAVSDLDARRHRLAERRNRPGPGTAGACGDSLELFLEDWSVRSQPQPHFGSAHRLRASGADFSIDLTLLPLKGPVIHGRDGISRKAREEGHASHYYSLPRLTTSGTLSIAGDTLRVTGSSWMDHEFGSAQLAPGQSGWDWMGLQLDDGSELMLYRLRGEDGPFRQGTLIPASGAPIPLGENDFRMDPLDEWPSPRTAARYPVRWRVEIPRHDIRFEATARFAEQELLTPRSTGVTYWEGSVEVNGTAAGRPLTGEGYLEMTGYAGAFHPQI